MTRLEELTDGASLEKWRAVVGGWLEVVIGRGSPTAGEAAVLQPIVSAMLQGAGDSGGAVTLGLPVLSWSGPGTGSQGTARATIEWAGEAAGVAILVASSGNSLAEVELAEARFTLMTGGLAVLTVELLGGDLAEVPVVGDREAACYTLGYNYSLFAHRVHDVLTCVAAVAGVAGAGGVHLLGVGHPAGSIVAAAGAMCDKGMLTSIAVETGGWRFGDITEVRDPNLLPGACKYGDLPALLAMCAPTPLTISEPAVPPLVAAAYGVEPESPQPRAQPEGHGDLVEFWGQQWQGDDETASL